MLLTASPSSLTFGGAYSASELSGVVEALVAVFNLVLVIGFFVWERRDYKIREQIRIKEETYNSWFKLMVEERLIVEIDAYFDRVVEIVSAENSKSDAVIHIGELAGIVDQIKTEMVQKKRILIPTLDMFSKSFRKNIWGIFQESHEAILQKVEAIHMQKETREDLLEFLNESKAKLYLELYDFHLKQIEMIISEGGKGCGRRRKK